MDSVTARERIAERVKNAYAAGHNDGRHGRFDRMDEVAETETARILEVVREALLSDGVMAAVVLGNMDRYYDKTTWLEDARVAMSEALDAAFGADDDGGER